MWLFNIRGKDVDCNPVALSYALVRVEGEVTLYVEAGKVTEAVAQHLKVRREGVGGGGAEEWGDEWGASQGVCVEVGGAGTGPGETGGCGVGGWRGAKRPGQGTCPGKTLVRTSSF